jgi:hypothetical protein
MKRSTQERALQNKKVFYLSGPMRPIADHNFPLFKKVSAQLRADGVEIISPHEYGDELNDSRGQLMTDDLLMILNDCDGVIVLPGWESSPGASAEVAVAFGTELPVYEYIPDSVSNLLGYHLVESKTTSVTVPRETQYANGTPLIGLCGYAQVGKDTVAGFLKTQGWTRVAFADALRDVLYALNPIVQGGSYFERVQDLVDRHGWDKAKVDYQEIRQLLQRLGTEAGRDTLGENVWVRIGEDKIEAANGPVVVTDCRFPNEVQLIKRRKGTLIWIERPGTGAANAHASEHSVTRDDCDIVLNNNGTFEDLYRKIDKFVGRGPFPSTKREYKTAEESNGWRKLS